jgi:PAS domain-containing protein
MDIRKHVRKSGLQSEFCAVRARPMRAAQRNEPETTDLGLHLAATLEATEDCLVLTDNDGAILNMNRRFSQLWPLPEQLLVERDDRGIVAFIDHLLRDEPDQPHQPTMLQQGPPVRFVQIRPLQPNSTEAGSCKLASLQASSQSGSPQIA